MWALWWIWAVGAVALGVLEVLVPGYIFLGFAIGAGITAIVLIAGGPLAALVAGSFPVLILFYAVISLVSWILLRRLLGVRRGQVKIWDRDINED